MSVLLDLKKNLQAAIEEQERLQSKNNSLVNRNKILSKELLDIEEKIEELKKIKMNLENEIQKERQEIFDRMLKKENEIDQKLAHANQLENKFKKESLKLSQDIDDFKKREVVFNEKLKSIEEKEKLFQDFAKKTSKI